MSLKQIFFRFIKEKSLFEGKSISKKIKNITLVNDLSEYEIIHFIDENLGWSSTKEGYYYWWNLQMVFVEAVLYLFKSKEDFSKLEDVLGYFKELTSYFDYPFNKETIGVSERRNWATSVYNEYIKLLNYKMRV